MNYGAASRVVSDPIWKNETGPIPLGRFKVTVQPPGFQVTDSSNGTPSACLILPVIRKVTGSQGHVDQEPFFTASKLKVSLLRRIVPILGSVSGSSSFRVFIDSA